MAVWKKEFLMDNWIFQYLHSVRSRRCYKTMLDGTTCWGIVKLVTTGDCVTVSVKPVLVKNVFKTTLEIKPTNLSPSNVQADINNFEKHFQKQYSDPNLGRFFFTKLNEFTHWLTGLFKDCLYLKNPNRCRIFPISDNLFSFWDCKMKMIHTFK